MSSPSPSVCVPEEAVGVGLSNTMLGVEDVGSVLRSVAIDGLLTAVGGGDFTRDAFNPDWLLLPLDALLGL